MVRRPVLAVAATCLMMLCCAAAQAARIEVRTDRDPVPVDESFRITFEAEAGVDGDPDFSPMEKDFQVLATSQSSRYSFGTGGTSSLKTWTLTVIARRPGRLVIPPISFGSDRSPPLPVNVTEAGSGAAPATDRSEIFIEVEAQPLQPRVQAEVIYRVRLYLGVPVSNASLSDPEVQKGQAVIERLDADRNYDTEVMGRRFQVLERSYAVYPQASGPLTLGPVQFQGRVGRDVFSLFDPFGPQPKTVQRQSAPVTLQVQPVPADFPGRYWLPARRVEIREEWSRDPPRFHVGEPITRTLTLKAEGLSSSQLPELAGRYPDVFKVYPDQPALEDRKAGDGITGSRQEKAALIPQEPGAYLLPEISIPWWNTRTNRLELAKLPARRVQVLPAAGATGGAGAPAPQAAAPDLPPQQAPSPDAAVNAPRPAPAADASPWMWLSFALALAWLGTVWLWLWQRRREGRVPPDEVARRESRRKARRLLRDACAANDPRAARDALLKWAAESSGAPVPRSIGELAARSREPLAQELRQLNAALYAREGTAWNGAGLWRAFETAVPAATAAGTGSDGDLQPLFRL